MQTNEVVEPVRDNRLTLPAVTKIGPGAPFDWLKGAWGDLWKIPGPALTYGVILALISGGLAYALFFSGYSSWIMVLAGGFLFVGPMFAMGLYEAGRQLERGQSPKLGEMLFVKTNSTMCLAYLGLALLMIYFLWTRIGQVVYGLSTYKVHRNIHDFIQFMIFDPEGHSMAITGTIIGGAMAFVAYCLVVITAPMLLEQHTNVFSATATSFRAVAKNLFPMLIWGALIAVLTVIGIATGFLGLIIIFPWIGLASWRAYRALVDSPEHPGFQSS